MPAVANSNTFSSSSCKANDFYPSSSHNRLSLVWTKSLFAQLPKVFIEILDVK